MKRKLPSDTIEFHSNMKIVNKKIVWKIENFSFRPEQTGQAIGSSKFEIVDRTGDKQKWSLQINPRGFENANSVSAGITLVECVKTEVMAKITFAIQSASGKETLRSEMTTRNFTRGLQYRHSIIKRDSLLADTNELLPSDQLTIICNIDICQLETLSNGSGNNSMEIHSLLTKNFGNLLENKTFADCVLVTSDQKEFQAHKNILACRSPVFAAMFKDEMVEGKTGRVEIADIQADTLQQMLRFIYTGAVSNLEGNASELLVAADKYQLMELKRHCEQTLAVSLNSKNACELLIFADLHSAKHLKSQALDFIKSHTNEVMGSAGWKTLRIDLLNQIIQSFSDQQMK